jgi:hypothetical protein
MHPRSLPGARGERGGFVMKEGKGVMNRQVLAIVFGIALLAGVPSEVL